MTIPNFYYQSFSVKKINNLETIRQRKSLFLVLVFNFKTNHKIIRRYFSKENNLSKLYRNICQH